MLYHYIFLYTNTLIRRIKKSNMLILFNNRIIKLTFHLWLMINCCFLGRQALSLFCLPHCFTIMLFLEENLLMSSQGSGGNVLAAICNVFIPGLGQLVQGRIFAALLFFASTNA